MIQASRLYPPRVYAAETYKRAQCDASADGCDSARVSSDALAGARDPWDAFGDPRLVLASASLTSPELTGTASSASLTRRSFVHRPRGTHAAAAAALSLARVEASNPGHVAPCDSRGFAQGTGIGGDRRLALEDPGGGGVGGPAPRPSGSLLRHSPVAPTRPLLLPQNEPPPPLLRRLRAAVPNDASPDATDEHDVCPPPDTSGSPRLVPAVFVCTAGPSPPSAPGSSHLAALAPARLVSALCQNALNSKGWR